MASLFYTALSYKEKFDADHYVKPGLHVRRERKRKDGKKHKCSRSLFPKMANEADLPYVCIFVCVAPVHTYEVQTQIQVEGNENFPLILVPALALAFAFALRFFTRVFPCVCIKFPYVARVTQALLSLLSYTLPPGQSLTTLLSPLQC